MDAIAGSIIFLVVLGLIKAVWPKSNAVAASKAATSITPENIEYIARNVFLYVSTGLQLEYARDGSHATINWPNYIPLPERRMAKYVAKCGYEYEHIPSDSIVWSKVKITPVASLPIAEPKPLPKVITDRISIEQAIADIEKPTCIVVYDYCAQIHFDRRMIPLQQIHEALALAGWKCPYPPIWSERTSILTIVRMSDVS